MKVIRCLDVASRVLWEEKWMKQDTVTKEADGKNTITEFDKLHAEVEGKELWTDTV